jgi:plastocyanin
LLSAASAAHAATTVVSPNIFKVDEGVAFTIGNIGTSQFTFNWADPSYYSTSFSNKPNPTFILSAGQTYTFQRSSSAHPFVIMDDNAARFMTGNDESGYSRTTTDGTLITAATLQPIADFTADPAPTADLITWTPTAGTFWYTCSVTGHTGMAGKITVIPEPSTLGLAAAALLGLALVKQRSRRTKGPGLSDRSGSASQS